MLSLSKHPVPELVEASRVLLLEAFGTEQFVRL